MQSQEKQLIDKLRGVSLNEPLASFTSFNIGGPAKYFYIAKNNDSIINAIDTVRQLGIDFFILGDGTNILVADDGFNGLVIKIENKKIEFYDKKVTAESGVKLQKLIRESINRSLTGLEFLIGIPGTVGGAVAGNVGTPNTWIDTKILEVEIINTENKCEIIPKSKCDFTYRSSRFKYTDKEIILSATLKLAKSTHEQIQSKIKSYYNKRSHQPVNLQSAGSIFKNPTNQKAWELIDKIDFRGKQIGGARVSQKHSNFIINTGQAKAEDVIILISMIKQQVRNKFGIQLQEEIKYIGF